MLPADSALSPELWAQVFAYLQPPFNVDDQDLYGTVRLCELDPLIAHVSAFYSLRLVCKTFNEVILNNSGWFRLLCFSYDSCSSGSWNTWIQRHRHQVQTYIAAPVPASVKPQPLQVSRTLMCPNSRLSLVSMPTPLGRCALNSLATFNALTSCTLHNPRHPLGRAPGRIDLLPLGSLNHLEDLSLQGPTEYTNLGAVLQNLTKLAVSDTTVYEFSTCVSATKLRSLYIQNGMISCALSPGLFACEQLQELGCINSIIAADDRANVLCTNNEVTCIPSKITALTQLKFMEMHVAKVEEWPQAAGLFEFAWLTHLTNLQHLALRVEYDIKIPSGLSNLCKLTKCQLLLPEAAGPVLDLDWAKLVCLQTLRIVGGTLIFDHQLLRLASVTTLDEVSIDCAPNDSVSTACLAALASCFSRDAPHVKLTICGTTAADVYAKAFPTGIES